MLAAGISEAMNCTAFGLIVGLTCIVGYGVLRAAEDALVADLDAGALQILRVLDEQRACDDVLIAASGPYRNRAA